MMTYPNVCSITLDPMPKTDGEQDFWMNAQTVVDDKDLQINTIHDFKKYLTTQLAEQLTETLISNDYIDIEVRKEHGQTKYGAKLYVHIVDMKEKLR